MSEISLEKVEPHCKGDDFFMGKQHEVAAQVSLKETIFYGMDRILSRPRETVQSIIALWETGNRD